MINLAHRSRDRVTQRVPSSSSSSGSGISSQHFLLPQPLDVPSGGSQPPEGDAGSWALFLWCSPTHPSASAAGQLDRCLPTKPCPHTALQPEVWLELELTWGIFPSVCWRTQVWDSQREELAPRMFFYSSLGIP